jgi:general L-amino acid transport system substrate-binding protein
MLARNRIRMTKIPLVLFLFAEMMIATLAMAQTGSTLEKIKTAGSLPCGPNTEEPEYSLQDAHGSHAALDLDICKALAVAVLGPSAKFTVVPFQDEEDALKGLKSGKIAVLATGSPNYINTTNRGFGFARPIYTQRNK